MEAAMAEFFWTRTRDNQVRFCEGEAERNCGTEQIVDKVIG